MCFPTSLTNIGQECRQLGSKRLSKHNASRRKQYLRGELRPPCGAFLLEVVLDASERMMQEEAAAAKHGQQPTHRTRDTDRREGKEH